MYVCGSIQIKNTGKNKDHISVTLSTLLFGALRLLLLLSEVRLVY